MKINNYILEILHIGFLGNWRLCKKKILSFFVKIKKKLREI